MLGAVQSILPIDVLFWVLLGLALGYYATCHFLFTGRAA